VGVILDKVLAAQGKTVGEMRRAGLGAAVRKGGVTASPEWRRIDALPRRPIPSEAELAEIAAFVTAELKTPAGTMTLWPDQAFALLEIETERGLLGGLRVSGGKAQPVDEPVLTPSGWRPIGSLRVGDFVTGSDGRPTRVSGVFPQGVKDIFTLTFNDGGSARSTADHLWSFRSHRTDGGRRLVTKPLSSWMRTELRRPDNDQYKWQVPVLSAPVSYAQQDALPLDPYTLGLLLGDGGMTQATISFTSMDADITSALRLPEGVRLVECLHQNSGRATQFNLTRPRGSGPNPLTSILKDLGLHGCSSLTKFVPQAFKTSTPEERLALLHGLFDTDGTPHHAGNVDYSTSSQRLALDVQEIVRSLGGVARVCLKPTAHALHYRLIVRMPEGTRRFRCARKSSSDVPSRRRVKGRSLVSIEPAGRAEAVCIAVEAPDHLYVTKDFILTHNTLIALLAPTVLNAVRPVLIVPAKHKGKTDRAYRAMKEHWRLHPGLQIISYEDLSNQAWCEWLEKYQPDVIVGDEAHRLKDGESARGLRFERFYEAYNPAVVWLSGTFWRKSPKDIQSLGAYALRDRSPVPRTYKECDDWASALDPKARKPLGPGALMRWAAEGETVHEAFGRRLTETPGVIFSRGAGVEVSLTVEAKIVNHEASEEHFKALRAYWEKPDGWRINDAPVRHMCARMFGLGFYHTYTPYPPKPWMEARRWWNRLVTYLIRKSQLASWEGPRLDSELQARLWCARFEDELAEIELCHKTLDVEVRRTGREIRDEWITQEPTWDETAEPVWFSTVVLEKAERWAKRHKGLIWTPFRAFGLELAKRTGLSYYGDDSNATDVNGRSILDAPGGEAAIVSVAGCGEGFDLQDRWSQSLYVSPMSSGQEWEQTLARIHRFGQQADEVSAEVWLTCIENYTSLLGAIAEEQATSKATRDPARKLVVADLDLPDAADIRKLERLARWSERTIIPAD
jgi:hypothetical protein